MSYKPDPNDRKLRNVEKDILIPRYMELKINEQDQYCKKQLEEFKICAKDAQLLVVWNCKPIWRTFVECSNKWFADEGLRKEVTEEYLEKRRAHRAGEKTERSPFARLRV